MRKRDAVIVVLLCAFAIVGAGAISLGGHMHAKVLMCTVNLQKIGLAMAAYTDSYDGSLPLIEKYNDAVPSIESTYLLSRSGTSGATYRQLGCLYGAGLITDGQSLFCPAVPGWRGEMTNLGQNNGTYLGAVHSTTKKYADITPGVSQPNQGWKATRAYCYWPLSKRIIISQADLMKINVNSMSRYNVGLPYSATKADDLNPAKPIVTDNKFHSIKTGEWMVNCLHPDGHVTYQQQPKAEGLNGYGAAGTWGMYSADENCQFPSDIMSQTYPRTITDPQEKGTNLATAVTPTQFAWALQP